MMRRDEVMAFLARRLERNRKLIRELRPLLVELRRVVEEVLNVLPEDLDVFYVEKRTSRKRYRDREYVYTYVEVRRGAKRGNDNSRLLIRLPPGQDAFFQELLEENWLSNLYGSLRKLRAVIDIILDFSA